MIILKHPLPLLYEYITIVYCECYIYAYITVLYISGWCKYKYVFNIIWIQRV